MSKRVGESRADDRPWRRGPLVDAIKDKTSGFRVSVIPRRMRMFPFTAPTVPTTVEPYAADRELGVDFDTAWARKPSARAARTAIQKGLLMPALWVWTSPEVFGRDRFEHLDGPLIFAANHHSHLDTGMVLAALSARLRNKTIVAAAGDYFFDKRAKAIASALTLNAVPIERQKVSRRSTDQIATLLSGGWNLVIFPEGGRSPDGLGQEFKAGSTYLAVKCQCPIVPVYIDGTDVVFPKGASMPRRHGCTVTFGEPIVPTADDDPRRLAERLERAIDSLAEEVRSDWWTARRRAASGLTTSLRGEVDAASWRRQWDRNATSPNSTNRNQSKASSDWP